MLPLLLEANDVRPQQGRTTFSMGMKHELHSGTTLKQSAMSSTIISALLITASAVIILLIFAINLDRRTKRKAGHSPYSQANTDAEEEDKEKDKALNEEKEAEKSTSQETPPRLKAGFDMVKMVEKILMRNNCRYSIDRFKDLHIFSFNYQGGHLYISCKDDDPFIEIVYPSIYRAELIELNLIRRNCNKINGMWTMVRACYDIEGDKNCISVELRSTLLIGNDEKRNDEALAETFSTIFSIYKNFFLWMSNEKRVSKKCAAGDLDLYISHNDRMDSMIAEQEINHGKQKLNFRPNDTNKFTIGQALKLILNIHEPHYNRLQIVYDNGHTFVVDNAEDIENFDALSPFDKEQAGNGTVPAEFATLNVSLTMPEQKGDPVEYEKARKAVVTFIMNKVSSDDTTAYIRTTIVSTSMYPLSQYHKRNNETMSRTILLPLDFGNTEKKLAEFRYLWMDAHDKVAEGKASTMSERQRLIVDEQDWETAYCLYWGTAYFESKLYYAALLLLENAWTTLNERYPRMNKQQREQFYHVCFLIGFCYTDLRIYKKAYFYLDILFPLNNFQYTCEYINCLVNAKDFRAINIINTLLGQMELANNENQEEQSEVHNSFYRFLKRRKGYVLIDMGRLDEAEVMFEEMLDDPLNADFALGELAYIQKIKNNQEKESD